MEIEKFEIKFVQRTKDLLLGYQGPWDMCNLLNCTLGLIVLPYETIKKNPQTPYWQKRLDQITSFPRFTLTFFEPIKKIENGTITYYPKTLKVLLQKIRNGLAHQNIEPVNQSGEFSGVIIRNYFDEAKKRKDLEIQFSQQELKDFCIFIADEYLKQ